jgi:hypothetical protein
MIQAKHCDLCEYPKRNLKNGLTCGLTDKKPDFKVACSEIKFSNSFKEYLPVLLNLIEHTKKRKTSVYLKFTLLSAIGLIIIFGSYTLLEQTFELDYGYDSWIRLNNPLFLYVVGAFFILMAFSGLNKYRKTFKILEYEKRELDNILNNYNIDIETLLERKKE